MCSKWENEIGKKIIAKRKNIHLISRSSKKNRCFKNLIRKEKQNYYFLHVYHQKYSKKVIKMKNSITLINSIFAFVFIDFLVIFLVFIVSTTPKSFQEGVFIVNFDYKFYSCFGPILENKNEKKIIVYAKENSLFIGGNIYSGKNRYQELQDLLKKLTILYKNSTHVKSVRFLLDPPPNLTFQNIISFLEVCHNLKKTNKHFISFSFDTRYRIAQNSK